MILHRSILMSKGFLIMSCFDLKLSKSKVFMYTSLDAFRKLQRKIKGYKKEIVKELGLAVYEKLSLDPSLLTVV